MKMCSKCKTVKPVAWFPKAKRYAGGRYCWCRECTKAYSGSPERKARDRDLYHQKYATKSARESRNAYCRARYAKPKEKRRHKDEMYQRKYGITLEFFESEVQKQKSRCKLCSQTRDLVADHNHKTGKYRGAICRLCNVAIGRIELVPDFISKAEDYLR